MGQVAYTRCSRLGEYKHCVNVCGRVRGNGAHLGKDCHYCSPLTVCLSVQVETWLNSLLNRMVATIRHNFSEAVMTYEEKPREQWIFDPPAQVCVREHALASPSPGR